MLLDSSFRLPRWAILALWIVALLLLMAGLGTPVVTRTQEARVLETAREMLASGDWRQWMIPQLNGELRLNKPPLAYWLAAGSFRLFGVSEFAGRFPFALAGWLTLAVVYQFARRLMDQAFALFSAAILLTSLMFFVHFRLAETDAIAALFVASATYWLWKGAGESGRKSFIAFHLGGASMAMAILGKGPPGVFPALFFLAWVAVEKDWDALRRFAKSGALVTIALLAGWWFIYVRTSPAAHVIGDELAVVTGGEDHKQAFYLYFPQILRAIAPWTGLFILGVSWCIRDWRATYVARVALLWLAVVLIPLCLIGNRQDHYLVPLTPALAMLTAYAARRGMEATVPDARAAYWVIAITIGLSLLAPIGVYWFARHEAGYLQTLDLIMMGTIAAGGVAAALLGRRYGVAAAAGVYAVALSLVLPVTFGGWLPSLQRVTHRTVASDLRQRFGDGRYVFYGKDPSLPLVWNLRQVVPTVESQQALEKLLTGSPQTIVIAQTKNKRLPPPIPPSLQLVTEFELGGEGMTFRIYRVGG